MREADADSISTVVGANASGTFLAGINHGFRGVGGDWFGVVC
jgi:hypothetical protein